MQFDDVDRDERAAAIRAFWDTRAEELGSQPEATLGETDLRRLEIRTMQRLILRLHPARVLDVGCGNGFSTVAFAARCPEAQFIGVDFSREMIARVPKGHPPNCSFAVADVTSPSTLPEGEFDLIFTQRCLQNLPDYQTQKTAIAHLKRKLTKHGTLALMECSKGGVGQMNRTRRRLGCSEIDGVEPWHNCFFHDEDLVKDFGAQIIRFSSTYMLLTRLVCPRLGRLVRLRRCLERLAWRLPPVGRFGYDNLYLIR